MRAVRRTTQFKKDVKRVRRRRKDLEKLRVVVEMLVRGQALPANYRDHELTGEFKGIRDRHLEPDWLLLYQADDEELVLIRRGSHADLFRQ